MAHDTIEIPATVDDMRIKHWPFLRELQKIDAEDRTPTIPEMARMNSLFTGVPIRQMKRYSTTDVENLFNQICERFQGYEQKPLPLDLEYDGKKYTFRHDFSKLPVDWYIDVDEADLEEEPIEIISFCYIEEGLSYGEPDEHDNVLNPRSERNEVFKEHVPLSLFLDIQAFFLLKWNVWEQLLTRVTSQTQSEKRNTKKSTSNGNPQ